MSEVTGNFLTYQEIKTYFVFELNFFQWKAEYGPVIEVFIRDYTKDLILWQDQVLLYHYEIQ